MNDNTQQNGYVIRRVEKIEIESQVSLRKEEVIEILKTIEGIKRKLLNTLKA